MYKIVDGRRVYNDIYVVTYVPQEIPEGGENFVDYSEIQTITVLKNTTWETALKTCKLHYGAKNVRSNKKWLQIIVNYKAVK